MKQTKWTKKRSEGLPRWAMGLLMGLCIGLIVVALGGLVIFDGGVVCGRIPQNF